MKVLIIQVKKGIGDGVIYLPYIHAISKFYGKPVSILVKESSKANELLADDNHINEIMYLDRTKKKDGHHDGLSGFFKLVKRLRVKKYDKVFIFNSSLRYFLVAKFAGIKKIAQYPLFKKKDNIVTSAKIFTENQLNSIVSTEPFLILKKDDKIKNYKKVSPEMKHICLGISASGPTKRWDIHNFINLCIKINAYVPTKFYLAGGKNDKDLFKKVLNSQIGSNCVSFEELKIRETLPKIKDCDLYIGNDTGWLHIASALGIKCLALFMDSPVMAYGKYSNNISVIVPHGETEESTTHDTLGKNRISFEEVYSKSIKLLN